MGHALTEQATREFFDAPTAETFHALQQAAIGSAHYEPSAARLSSIEVRLTVGDPVRLLEELHQLPNAYHICPRFHYVEARIRESLDEFDEMEESIGRLRTCLKAIVETGEGSQDSPFSVTFTTDEDDVMRSFGERVRCQQVVTCKDQYFDVLTAHSGVEFWFDVSKILARINELQSEPSTVQEIS